MDKTDSTNHFDALEFEAPYLIERLIKNNIVDTEKEGVDLFQEVKRYIVLSRVKNDTVWDMYSIRVDEVWHQFILFTQEYVDFSFNYFKHYVHHSPANSPKPDKPNMETISRKESGFEDFKASYEELFGIPLSDTWYDWKNISLHSRLVNEEIGNLVSRNNNDLVQIFNQRGEELLALNDFAREAVEFIVSTPAFYVRELPGGLHEEESIALISTLVRLKLLKFIP